MARQSREIGETMKNSLDKFKQKLLNDDFVIGPFMKTGDPAFVEAAGHAGFDFAILDMEHGPANITDMQNLIRAAEVSGILPIVRVPDISEEAIGKPLDIGAKGVQIPQVTSAEEAEQAVAFAKFFPMGERGVCRFVRAAKYTHTERGEYFDNANQNLVILQLEGKEALLNLDDILKVEGVDIIFIGPYDLSQSLGVPGQVTHPRVIEEMTKIVIRAREAGMVVGTFVDTMEDTKRWKDAGVQYLSYSVDVGLFYDKCRDIVDSIENL